MQMASPMAGSFYRSPAPGEPSFCKEGDKVTKGQTVCIIEAMKLMNEIEVRPSCGCMDASCGCMAMYLQQSNTVCILLIWLCPGLCLDTVADSAVQPRQAACPKVLR